MQNNAIFAIPAIIFLILCIFLYKKSIAIVWWICCFFSLYFGFTSRQSISMNGAASFVSYRIATICMHVWCVELKIYTKIRCRASAKPFLFQSMTIARPKSSYGHRFHWFPSDPWVYLSICWYALFISILITSRGKREYQLLCVDGCNGCTASLYKHILPKRKLHRWLTKHVHFIMFTTKHKIKWIPYLH